MTAVDVVVRGRVQGVGFRFQLVEEAEELGVTGWVRNEPDGSVAAHFEGAADAVDRLVEWCRQGPRHAKVEARRRDRGRGDRRRIVRRAVVSVRPSGPHVWPWRVRRG